MAESRVLIPSRMPPPMPIEDADAAQRRSFHRSLPGYGETPLRRLRSLAADLGVSQLYVKDESVRLGLPAFKMLGASWATARAIRREWAPGIPLQLDALRDAATARPGRRLVAATDGNHGRGVARMAALLGIECEIFVPAGTAAARIADIQGEGARVTVVQGTYDDTVRRSAEQADGNSLVISDTSWPGYVETPRDVIRGYATMFEEVDDAIDREGLARPTHLFLQAGVGAFAAAAITHYAAEGGNRPVTVVVEPADAACLLASAENGEVTEVPGPHRSTMAGLNCGMPSLLAWPTVRGGTDGYVAISDERAHEAMRSLAQAGVVAGESGAAALAGLHALVDDRAAADALGLTEASVVLVVNTEGATDPANYRAQVGREPAEIGRGADPDPTHTHVTKSAGRTAHAR